MAEICKIYTWESREVEEYKPYEIRREGEGQLTCAELEARLQIDGKAERLQRVGGQAAELE